VAPVELAGIAWGEYQRYERLRSRWTGLARFPLLHEALHAVIRTAVTLDLQAFIQPPGRAPLRLGQVLLGSQPGFECGLELAQLGRGLLLTLVHRRSRAVQMLANGRTREVKAAGNGANALATDQMPPPNFGNDVHR
jgi:hypothetical protein